MPLTKPMSAPTASIDGDRGRDGLAAAGEQAAALIDR